VRPTAAREVRHAPQAIGTADALLAGGGASNYAPLLSGAYQPRPNCLLPCI
jgi:hypothetical protein